MKDLFFICHLLVLHGLTVSLIRQYFYIPQVMNWTTAQNYCREHYGDFATITTEKENKNAIQLVGTNFWAWIGLNRTAPHVDIWQWSDGEKTNFTQWSNPEPNDFSPDGESCVVISPYGWNDVGCQARYSFLCSRRFMLVKEKKTWEEALQHCRTHYSNLAIVDSQTVLDLLKTETEEAQTASVWTDLRFLDGKWFWVNGTTLGSLVSLPTCPIQSYGCGAYNFNTYVWENRDCSEELNFLCYH
ncbi:hypothetical protein Q7C36_008477 [Tachysurus vachellii]|uniref:C-type lectin domain-containing protein n=1 Tax=Tachysurus vachellii TaxID=175792 RepID=A0AA88N1D4_TACVA|nr:hypothetical protein Q7C36_008477 [Tachysurus vachellii]